MRQYQWLLEWVLTEHPDQRRYLSHCCHCDIAFLSDPRNAGREDLRCPFGCSDAFRKQASTRRSVEYYRTPEGKIKKRLQNNKRRKAPETPPPPVETLPPVDSTPVQPDDPLLEQQPQAKDPCHRSVIEHVRMLTSIIEGRQVTRDETVRMLHQVLRQHSIARRRKLDHLVNQLHQNPP